MDIICKNYPTVLTSLSHVIGVSKNEIVSVLKHDWDKQYETEYNAFIQSDLPEESFPDDLGEYILLNGFSEVDITGIRPTVHWFHGARAIDPEEYYQYGILPLSEMYPKIKQMVDCIASKLHIPQKDCISELQKHNRWLAEMKLRDPHVHGGPFAMLMYEAASLPEKFGNHSYIEEPEFISNYAYMMYDNDAVLILEEIKKTAFPIIVEFIEPKDNNSIPLKSVITTIIQYLYREVHGEEVIIHSNTCFSNQGNSIPSDLIVKIHRI